MEDLLTEIKQFLGWICNHFLSLTQIFFENLVKIRTRFQTFQFDFMIFLRKNTLPAFYRFHLQG